MRTSVRLRAPVVLACCLFGWTVAAAAAPRPRAGAQPTVVRLATTTSTADTGLLGDILPDFERQCRCQVEVVAVGTGQALELGRRGDVDVLLVHAREAEEAFVKEGHGIRRDDVMYNDFVIVGPASDPAGVGGTTRARDAFKAIWTAAAPFASRGDRSGTHTKELALWKTAGVAPTAALKWYLSVGQGMGETLTFASERQAYTLSDRATWLSMRGRLGALRQVFGGDTPAANPDTDLRNDYGVIAINPKRHPGTRAQLAGQFVDWLLSRPTQERIGAFGREKFGQPLFYPNSNETKVTREVRVQVGSAARVFTLADLKALPRVTLPDYEVIGVKRGPLGRSIWAGTALTDLLLVVNPGLARPDRAAEAAPPVLLAYERDGLAMTGRDGLIQLVVGSDQFASRYAHWVATVRVR